jgi:two-component system, OmpR family, sensor kinase
MLDPPKALMLTPSQAPSGIRSLRAKLLAWYGLVLVAVLATFAALAVWTVWQSGLRDVDTRLTATASFLARAIELDSAGQYEVNLTDPDLAEFTVRDDGPYYGVWTSEGALIDRSDPRIDPTFPGAPQVRTLGANREVIVAGDHGALVLVGDSLAQFRSDFRRAILGFAAAAGVALALALGGGWFLVGRALAPVERIAETAEAMSESNLGLRIDVTRTEDELGAVATSLNRAFDRLQEAFERQTRFTADASHELRTPLASLMAELEWALARPRASGEYRDSLAVCRRAAQRMRGVVEGLLTLARADAGAIEPQREPVNLATVVEDAVSSVGSMATERGITIAVDGVPAIVNGDPNRLRELISNLLINAVQHSFRGGTVTCSVSALGPMTCMVVSDTGAGVDAEDLPHIFERFYRAGRARSRASGGAGLGLAISKWIAESHGGHIRCESSKGQGARFVIELPALETSANQASGVTEDRAQAS